MTDHTAHTARIGIRGAAWRVWLAALTAIFGAALAQPAAAQPGPQGIGFAQAEEGTWSCRAGDPVTALNCARDLCRAQAADCFRTAWCFPAGWAGVVTVWNEDYHANRPLCGAPSLEALLTALRAYCNDAPFATACDLGLITDPDGVAVDLAERWIPTPAAPVAAPPAARK